MTSPDIGGLLSVNGSNSLRFPEVGLVHGVLVLGGDGSWITIVVWDFMRGLREFGGADDTDHANGFEHVYLLNYNN